MMRWQMPPKVQIKFLSNIYPHASRGVKRADSAQAYLYSRKDDCTTL